MARAYDESQEAYRNGDRARAKELSEEGQQHKAQMEALNQQASDWIFSGTTNSHIYKRKLTIL